MSRPAAAAPDPISRPTPRADRIAALDAVRGFALAGVLFANLPLFAGHPYMTGAQLAALPTAALDTLAHAAMQLLVEDKFMGLFALLFGVGAALQLARARAQGAAGVRLHVRRMAWLFAIGSVHGWLFWSFDILRFYALWGLLLPLFDRLRPRALLAWGLLAGVAVPAAWRAAVAALAPAAPLSSVQVPRPRLLEAFAAGDYLEALAANWAFDWQLTLSPTQGAYQAGVLGRMLLGVWLGRRLLETGLPARGTLLRGIAWTLPLGLAGSAVYAGLLGPRPGTIWRALPVEIGTLALTISYLAAALVVWQSRPAGRPLALLVPVGRMSLTNYLLQTAFGLWLFYGYLPGPGLMGRLGAAALVPLWAAVFAAQVALSHAWLHRFAFGPVEWLWRSLAYGRPQPWRLPAAAAPANGAVSPAT